MKITFLTTTVVCLLGGTAMAQTYLSQFSQVGGGFSGAPVTGNLNGITVGLGGGYSIGGGEGWLNTFGNDNANFSGAPFTYAEPTTDIVNLYMGADSSTSNSIHTIDFGSPVTDPFLHIDDLGDSSIIFSAPFTILSDDGALTSFGTTLQGSDPFNSPFPVDGSGTIQFSGIYTSIGLDINNLHNNQGFGIDIAVGYEDTTPVPEPSASFLGMLAAGALAFRRRRK